MLILLFIVSVAIFVLGTLFIKDWAYKTVTQMLSGI